MTDNRPGVALSPIPSQVADGCAGPPLWAHSEDESVNTANSDAAPGALALQDAWDDKYGPEAAVDAADLAQRGIGRIPFDLVVESEQDAAIVVGAIQLRRDTARRIREQAEQMAAQAEREADRIEERFTPALRSFTERAIEGGTARSIKIITGQGGSAPTAMGFRKVAGGLRIVDKDAAMAWAIDESIEADAVSVKTVMAPVAAAFKAHYDATGEIPGGCEVTESEDRFYVKEAK